MPARSKPMLRGHGSLESQGFRVARFWNNEVLEGVEGVLTRILEAATPSP